jgi:hypothetical protein
MLEIPSLNISKLFSPFIFPGNFPDSHYRVSTTSQNHYIPDLHLLAESSEIDNFSTPQAISMQLLLTFRPFPGIPRPIEYHTRLKAKF